MKRNQVILLSGMPASGKYTMARRLCDAGGCVLLDNHYFHDMFSDMIEIPTGQWEQYGTMIAPLRQNFLDVLRAYYPRDRQMRYIFTSVVVDGKKYPDELQKFAHDVNAEFIPIELHVSNDVLMSRCQTPDRQMRHKLCDVDRLSGVLDDIADKQYSFSHPNTLVLNTSEMSEDETFAEIERHLKQFD